MRRLVVGVEGSLSSVSAICGSATCVTAYAWALALLQQELWLSALCQTALVTALGKRALCAASLQSYCQAAPDSLAGDAHGRR